MSEPLEIRAWSPHEPPATREPPPEPRAPHFALDQVAGWDWAFRRNPAGTRLFLARRGARVVAHFGALPVRTRVLGEARMFAQLLATRLQPGESESEVLLPSARAFLAAHGGAQGDLVLYGWPDERDLVLAKTQLEFELLRVGCVLARTLEPGPTEPPPGVRALARFGPEVDVLYGCCATHWNASAIRDAAFLNWRFVEHPARPYHVFGVGSGAELRGYAVVRAAPELQAGLALLMDWLVLPGDEEACEGLLAAALACARAQGAVTLATSFPEWSPWSQTFQERGFLHFPTEHLQVVRSAVARFDMLWLRDAWWSTLADALLL